METVIMVLRASPLRCLTAIAVAGLAFVLAPQVPAIADEDPGVRAPRVRMAPPRTVHRVRTVQRVRTVVRTRTRVVCYDYMGRPFDCRTPAPIAPQPVQYTCGGCAPAAIAQPIVQYVQPAPRYYVPAYTPPAYAPVYTAPAYTRAVIAPRTWGTGCGSCAAQQVYYVHVRGHHHRGHGHAHRHRHAHYAVR
ncbi:MAG: hypothetical protein ACRECO_10975 [Xanthobacteraceae bacterium]